MEHGQIVLDLFVPADQDTAKAVHPTVSPFDHPAPGLVADLSFERLCLFTSGSDVQRVAEDLAQFSNFIVIVALVQAQMLWLFWRGLGPFYWNTFQRGSSHLEIITVGSLNRKPDRGPLAIH